MRLLETRDFFAQPAAERQKVFQLFDRFCRESPADNNACLASSRQLELLLIGIFESMKETGTLYPER